MRHITIIGLAFVGALAVGAMTASAASAVEICDKIAGNVNGHVTVSHCSDYGKGYKSASGFGEDLLYGGTFVWSKSKTQTQFNIGSVTDYGRQGCKKNNEEIGTLGYVTNTTSEVSSTGEEVGFIFCLNVTNGKITTGPEGSFSIIP
jgi:hypothetical protein